MRLTIPALAIVLALVAPAVAQQPEQPRAGGVFRVAMIGEPPTLDLHTTTAVIVQQITWHVYEGLYPYDRSYNAIPLLVDAHTVCDGGRTYTFRLRRGVKFHNGKELTSADVVASLKRWGRLATPGKQFWKNVEGVEAKDPHTVVMYLRDSSGALLMGLARPNNGAVIYPKEIVDAAGDNPVKDYVGTGPYRFVEHKPGLMADKRVRQAFQAALDMEPVMAAGFGNKAFYRLDPGLSFPEQPQWHSKAGGDLYNQKNPARARKLLEAAGYSGQSVRWITTKEYQWMYKNALVAKQQLEAVGFKINLEVVDWATLVQRRNKPEVWDVFSTGISFNPEPAFSTAVNCNWPGWWCHEDKEQWMDALAREAEPKKRRAMWEKVQTIFYEDVGRVKFGDFFGLTAIRKEVHGYRPTNEMNLWNVWLK